MPHAARRPAVGATSPHDPHATSDRPWRYPIDPMRTSVNWINDYLDPPATAEEQADLLTRAGFPFDGAEEVEGDRQQEIETTSNRGDCLCHLGLAREVAAISGRTLRPPTAVAAAIGPDVGSRATLRNERPDLCPLYTGRVILGATVKPSPAWLADRLRAIGQIPRNNIVDATNFVLFELGQPTHVFDLSLLRGESIVVRMAHRDEPFLPLGEGAAGIKLSTEDLVIADAERAVALAGVKGGAETAVTDSTTDLLLEAATFAPMTVRRTSQRHRIASDSSYRFERGVDPRQVDAAADRLAALILEIAGGQLCANVLREGAPLPEPRVISLRPRRCRDILGIEIADDRIIDGLQRLGLAPRRDAEALRCTVPSHRLDLEREIDLIEEVARMSGLDALPVAETIAVRVAPPQPTIAGRRALRDALAGMGLVETVTHSLVSEAAAAPFVPEGAAPLRVGDDRARAEPILRPSVLASLLRVRARNEDAGVRPLGLFEVAAAFHLRDEHHEERETLGILLDMEDARDLRPLRGIIDRAVRTLFGSDISVTVTAHDDRPWLQPCGAIQVDGRTIGRIGVIDDAVRKSFGLERPLAAAELEMEPMLAAYPPETVAQEMPAFPAIERDLSLVVDESVAWGDLEATIGSLELPLLEEITLVDVFRGRQVGDGKKGVTLRLRFRGSDRTLRHEEVDGPVGQVVEALGSVHHAELRG